MHINQFILWSQSMKCLSFKPYRRYCNIIWEQCNETLKDNLQTLQYEAARTVAKIRNDDANHMKLLSDFGGISVKNLINF